jgi:hypothetical protein
LLPGVELGLPKVELGLPGVELGLPKLELEFPKVELEVPEVELGLPEVELELPEVELELPEVELEVPEVELRLPKRAVMRRSGREFVEFRRMARIVAGGGEAAPGAGRSQGCVARRLFAACVWIVGPVGRRRGP